MVKVLPSPSLRAAFERSSSLRLVDWRKRHVDKLTRKKNARPNIRVDDQYIQEAFTFFKIHRKITKSKQFPSESARLDALCDALYGLNPGLFHAMVAADESTGAISGVVEARLLAGQSNEDIALRVNMPPAGVEWYERIYYNVRDRLQATDYIHQIVLKDAHNRTRLNNISRETAAKLMGFNHGPAALEVIISACDQGLLKPGYGASLVDYLEKMYEFLLIQRVQHVAQFAEIGEHNMQFLMEAHSRMRALRQQSQGIGGQQTTDVAVLAALQQALGFRIGESISDQPNDPRLAYMNGAAELRARELQKLSQGEQLMPPDEFSKFTLPKPKKKRAGDSNENN